MSSLKQILMERDGLSAEEANELIVQAHLRVMEGEDPEEILLEEFELEPDYIFDLL